MNFEELKQRVMLNKTPFLIIFLVVATVILVALALTTDKGSLPSPDKVTSEEEMAETSLSLSEVYPLEEEAAESASTMQTDVEIVTGKNKVTGVQLEIKYNPALLANVEIIPGDFFPNPSILLEKIDTTEGIISYALGSEEEGVSGEGIVASISFTPRGNFGGETSFEFLSKTAVSAEDSDTSVLREMNGLEFSLESEIVTSPSAQPTIAN